MNDFSKTVWVFITLLMFSFLLNQSFAQTGTANVDQPKKDFIETPLKEKLLGAKTIVFLGDSNTNAGEYINVFETALLLQRAQRIDGIIPQPEIINLGLPSETCCGLSEPIHPFPRPNVHERLARALEKTKPDIVFACYGMNDGIYHPFSDERFKSFQNGIMKLVALHKEAKVPLVLLTPPPFDPLPMQKSGKLVGKDAKEFSWKAIYEKYDSEVIEKYAKWMLEINEPNCWIVDVHQPIKNYLLEKRKLEPEFVFSNDGVHFDKRGHHVLANGMLKALGFSKIELGTAGKPDDPKSEKAADILKLVRQRRAIMHPAWLTEVGHKRPNVKPGLPLQEAKEKSGAIAGQITSRLKK